MIQYQRYCYNMINKAGEKWNGTTFSNIENLP